MSKDHELIIYNKKHYAEVIRSRLKKNQTTFLSPLSHLFNLVFFHIKKVLLNHLIIIDPLKELLKIYNKCLSFKKER